MSISAAEDSAAMWNSGVLLRQQKTGQCGEGHAKPDGLIFFNASTDEPIRAQKEKGNAE